MAFYYYKLAVDHGNKNALIKLGDCYRNGFGIEKDLREAARYYEKSIESNKLALIYLG